MRVKYMWIIDDLETQYPNATNARLARVRASEILSKRGVRSATDKNLMFNLRMANKRAF